MSHLVFLDEDEDTSTEEMSLNNRAGMHSGCCSQPPALEYSGGEEEVCERYVLYVPHDLMLMKRLWMAPALFIVITEVCVCVCVRP